jgi:PAS domain S-box-containing protein
MGFHSSSDGRGRLRATRWLVAFAVVLPFAVTFGAGWISWQQAWRDAARDTGQAAEVAAEYTRRILDGFVLRIDRANDLLAGLSDDDIRAREQELHEVLRAAAGSGLATQGHREPYVYVYDRDSVGLVSGLVFPVPPGVSFAQREFNQALRGPDTPDVSVSPVYVGAVTGEAFFAVTRRRQRTGNGLPSGEYDGVINASVFVAEMDASLRRLVRDRTDDTVALVRTDGLVLSRSTSVSPGTRLSPESPMLGVMASGAPSAFLVGRSGVDGVTRAVAYRRVEGYPLYTAATRPRSSILSAWATTASPLLATGLAACFILGALALLAGRQQKQLASANAGLEERVERRTAELRESEARSRSTLDALPQMVWSARPDGFNDFQNRRWYEATGTTETEMMGEGWRPVVHPEDLPRADARWRRSLASGEPFEVEYRLRMADGTWRWMLGQAVPMRDDEGHIVRWFGTATDIGEIVRARGILAREQEALESLVDERTQALREAQERLAHAQRMEALGQLAGGIAHDFNNVLQGVQGGAGLLQHRAEDAEAVRRVARMITEAAERGAAVTRRLLTFSRRGDLRAAPVDAGDLLHGLRELLGHTLGAGVRVSVSVADGLPSMLVDKAQVETVLVNLAANARDAMEGQGALVLAATLEELTVMNGTAKPGRYIRFTVTDTGPGMPPEVLARAAEPFFTTKGLGHGTGLGLAMAKGFAEQSGGALGIESEPGRGTTVILWFPVATTARAAELVGPPCTEPVARPRATSLLLVDDDAVPREATAEVLKQAGFTVEVFASAREALAAIEAGARPDVLLTDLSMPEMDGVTLAREAQRHLPRLPVIVLTGFVTAAAEAAVGRDLHGPFAMMTKPAAVEDIIDRVDGLLGNQLPESAGAG